MSFHGPLGTYCEGYATFMRDHSVAVDEPLLVKTPMYLHRRALYSVTLQISFLRISLAQDSRLRPSGFQALGLGWSKPSTPRFLPSTDDSTTHPPKLCLNLSGPQSRKFIHSIYGACGPEIHLRYGSWNQVPKIWRVWSGLSACSMESRGLWCIFEIAAFRKVNPSKPLSLKPLYVESIANCLKHRVLDLQRR